MTHVHFNYKCQENWESMRIGLHTRFCENCKIDVIDFTQKSREEILLYLLSNRDKQTCGRLLPSQLDFSHSDILITINGLTPIQKKSNLPFYLLTIGTLILTSCQNNSTSDIEAVPDQYEVVAKDDTLEQHPKTSPYDTLQSITEKTNDLVVYPEIGLLIVTPDTSYINNEHSNIVEPDTTQAYKEPYTVVEVMPEFVGGIDSLMRFIKNNINYPEWEKENNIEGTVYVTFVVNKLGEIKNPKILRSVSGSRNFDAEVFRVISLMPDWKPGAIGNTNVDVQYNLPIRFKL